MSLEIQKRQARSTRSMVRKAGHDHLVPKRRPRREGKKKRANNKMGGLNFVRDAKKLLKRLAQEKKEMHPKKSKKS